MLDLVTIRAANLRAVIATLAVVAVVFAAPLHSAHHHADHAGQLHVPCAVCQLHAPVGTPEATRDILVEPDDFDHLLPAPALEFQPAICGDVHACRAPPALLAT
jgi:hypothetical protein